MIKSNLQDIVCHYVCSKQVKFNPGKCHLLLSNKTPVVVSINGIQITSNTAH